MFGRAELIQVFFSKWKCIYETIFLGRALKKMPGMTYPFWKMPSHNGVGFTCELLQMFHGIQPFSSTHCWLPYRIEILTPFFRRKHCIGYSIQFNSMKWFCIGTGQLNIFCPDKEKILYFAIYIHIQLDTGMDKQNHFIYASA